MRNRILSFILVICMMVSFIPTRVLAAEKSASSGSETAPASVEQPDVVLVASEGFENGNGSEKTPYIIKTADQLSYLSTSALKGETYEGKYITIAADIDMKGRSWVPIVNFRGYLQGSNFTISNLVIENSSSVPVFNGIYCVGFIGKLEGSISNLNFSNISVNVTYGNVYCGAIAGFSNVGYITNCDVTGTVKCSTVGAGTVDVGGVIGYSTGKSNLAEIRSSASVIATTADGRINAGGILGNGSSGIWSCCATGKVEATAKGSSKLSRAGGLCGYLNNGVIENSYSTSNVSANSAGYSAIAGGLVGEAHLMGGDGGDYRIAKSYYAGGTVSANSDGANQHTYSGGIAGAITSGRIDSCFATGNITATTEYTESTSSGKGDQYTGVGYAGTITGKIITSANLTGITNCYYSSGMTFRRTTTEAYKWTEGSGCDAQEKNGYRHGTETSANPLHGTPTADANFKTSTFVSGTLKWTLFLNGNWHNYYNNVWIVDGSYPKLYTEYDHSATIVNYVGDKVFGVSCFICDPGYVLNYTVPKVTGYTADKAVISDTITSNKVYTVKYTPNKHLLTINYVSTKDHLKDILPQYAEFYSYGDYYDSILNDQLVPETIGYTVRPEDSRISGFMLDEDIHYTIYYEPNPCTITVNYLKTDGGLAAPSVKYDCFYDEEYSIPSPVVEGYTASQANVVGIAKGDSEINVMYSINPYTITVEHLYSDGTTAAEAEVFKREYGETYTFYPKDMEGYTPDCPMIMGVVGAEDVTLRFVYTRNYYNLTIMYVDAEGNGMAPMYRTTLPYGEAYSVVSPEVEGYQASPAVVEGVIKQNIAIAVQYNLNPHVLRINYYEGDVLIGFYEQKYDYTASYQVNTFDYVPNIYKIYYEFVDGDRTVISGIMPDNDVVIDVYFKRSVIANGTCEENISWTLYKDGELAIYTEGMGVMEDYTRGSAPWYEYRTDIKSVSIKGSLYNIGKYAFADCVNLRNTFFINKVTKVSEFAFVGCDNVYEIVINSSDVEIADGAFVGLENCVNFYVNEDNTRYAVIGGVLYNKDCTKLIAYPCGIHDSSVVLKEGLTEIGAYAFYGQNYITEVKFNQDIKTVGEYAFSGCRIVTLVLEGNISSIGTNAFNCSTLKAVYFKGDVPVAVGQSVFGNEENAILYYPAENTTWKGQITTEIVNNYKHYYWNGYKAYGASDIYDISLAYTSVLNIYSFRILYENDASAIENVEVKFNGFTKYTDEDGFVYFSTAGDMTWTELTLTKEGYNSSYNSPYRYVLKPIGIDYITMTDESSVQGITCNGDNIANGSAYINTLYDGDAKIIVQGNSNLEIYEMLIVQNGTILASSTDVRKDGRCTIEVKNGLFQKDAGNVYVYMRVKDGEVIRHAATAKLNLILISYDMRASELLSSFTSALGDTFNGMTIPINGTGIPFLDGSKITLTPPDFAGKAGALQKVSVDCDNNQVFVTYNLDGYGKEWEESTKQMQLEEYKAHVISGLSLEEYNKFCVENKYIDKDGNTNDAEALKNIISADDSGKLLTLDDFEIPSARKQKNFTSKLVNKVNEFFENNKKLKKVDTQAKFSFDIELAGGFVITFNENGHDIDPIIQISIQLKSSIGTQFVIAVINVPVVIELSAKAEGSVMFTQFHLDFAQQKLELPDYVKVDVNGSITVSVGVGTRNISLGVFGRIALETSIQIGGGDVYFDGLYFTGSVGVYAQAKILGFSVRWEHSWELFEWCAIQPRNKGSGNLKMISAYNLSAYQVGASLPSIEDVKWTSDGSIDVVNDSYAYSNAKIANVGEQLIMVYLDIVDDRNDYNSSTLMYSVFDSQKNKWSAGKEVDTNGQSESDFELLVADGVLYIVYTESNRLFGDDEFPADDSTKAMITTSKAQEIAVVRFDGEQQQFTDYRVLTNDDYQDSTPAIGFNNGKVTVAWVKNTGDDETAVFGANYNNEIYTSTYTDGAWSAPQCVQYGCGMIVDLAVGDTDAPTVSFIVDLDSDLYTDTDRSMYIYNASSGEIDFYEKYNTYVSNLQYVTLDGKKMLTWFEDYNIAYTLDGKNIAYMFENPVDNLDSAYKLVQIADGYQALIWTVPDEETSTVYASFRIEDGAWVKPVEMFKTSYYQMYMDVISVHGDLKFAFSSTQMRRLAQTTQMYSKIGYRSMTTGYGMEVNDVEMSADVENGLMHLDATITNTSIKEIQNVGIYIKEYHPDESKNKYYVGGVYPVNLTAGNTNSYSFSCDFIEGLDYPNCSLVVMVFEGTLADLEARVANLNLIEGDSGSSGYGDVVIQGGVHVENITGNGNSSGNSDTPTDYNYDLKLDGEYLIIGSTEYLSVRVTNLGTVAENATLRIYNADTNEVVYEAIIPNVPVNGTQYFLVKLEKEYFEKTDATFRCELIYDKDENIFDNYCDIVAYKVENADIVPYDELATAVDMSSHNAVFDKKDGNDVTVDIELNGNEFMGISNVESGKYWTVPTGEDSIKAIISGEYLMGWDNGDYPIEFLFKTERSWINSYLNLAITDTTPIDLAGSVYIEGTLTRGNRLTVDVSKLSDFYEISYKWYVGDVLVSEEATYKSSESDIGKRIRVEVTSTGLIEGRMSEEYLIDEVNEYTVDISSIQSSLQYKWYIDGEVLSEEPAYVITNSDIGKSIYVEVCGNGDYDGTIVSAVHDIPKVVRSVGTPVITSLTIGNNVVLGNMFLYGDGEMYYGYSLTDDYSTVDNWQKERTFVLTEDGYYYFFAKATEGDVYALTYSNSADYAYNVSKIVWIIDGNSEEEIVVNGTVPEYEGSVIKYNTSEYYYEFSGWDVDGDGQVDYTETDPLPAVNSETVTFTAVFTETPVIIAKQLNVKGSTLYIQSDISVNYYVSGAALGEFDSFYVEFIKEYCNPDGSTFLLKERVTEYTEKNNDYVFTYSGIAAKEMDDDIRTVVYAEKDGKVYCSETDVYSVAKYAYNRIAYSFNKDMVDLAISLLNYGAAAQDYFDYNEYYPANRLLTEAQKAKGEEDIELKSVKDYKTPDGALVVFLGASLSLENKVAIKYYFNMDNYVNFGHNKEDLSLVVKYGDQLEVIGYNEFGSSEDGLFASFDGLAAKDMRTVCEATFYMNYGSDDQQIVGETMVYSIESYAYSQMESTDSEMIAMVKAMMHYGEAAQAYAANT